MCWGRSLQGCEHQWQKSLRFHPRQGFHNGGMLCEGSPLLCTHPSAKAETANPGAEGAKTCWGVAAAVWDWSDRKVWHLFWALRSACWGDTSVLGFLLGMAAVSSAVVWGWAHCRDVSVGWQKTHRKVPTSLKSVTSWHRAAVQCSVFLVSVQRFAHPAAPHVPQWTTEEELMMVLSTAAWQLCRKSGCVLRKCACIAVLFFSKWNDTA